MSIDDLEFREFFATQFSRLYWLGLLLTGNPGQAEELAQDSMVRTYNRWALVRKPNDPALYARRVLVNRHRSLVRRALVEARHLAAARPLEPVPADLGEDAIVVWAAVARLPVRQRLVLALRYHEDLTEAQVASMLGLPLGTVKTLARRGLARLRAELAPVAQPQVDRVEEQR
ncbi:MAG TPA: SigE family RNA polymerase sigma factor [Actinomycetes bacterium]|nr:SigE family RNA polymerase sigma factor [Actinomycetes bacterium]